MKHLQLYTPALFTLAILLFSSSCSKNLTDPLPTDLIPIRSANYWAYKVNHYLYEDSTSTSYINIGNRITYQGESGYEWEEIPATTHEMSSFIRSDAEGNVIQAGAFINGDTLASPGVQYKRYAKTGESWDATRFVYNSTNAAISKQTYTITCINSDTSMVIISRPYTGYLFEYLDTNGDKIRDFVAPEVGIVKKEKFANDELIERYMLTTYTLQEE